MERKVVVLEPSTNTHKIEGNIVNVEEMGNGILKLQNVGDGIVTHGEHGTIRTESEHMIKYVQQELNPVTRALQNAYD